MPYPSRNSAGRITIGLYNSYDPVRFAEAHRRAVARAGPLCLAFDYNLALFGFPFPSGDEEAGTGLKLPRDVAGWLSTTTSIGEGGKYTMDLAERGRLHIFDFPKGGFPPQLGTVVLTTSKPREKKAMSMVEVAELARRSSLCLVFGLGPHGVPEKVFPMAKHHMDVTGSGRSLETCTAMGAVAAALFHLKVISKA